MLTAMVAVDNISAGETGKANLWSINTEQEYHEEGKRRLRLAAAWLRPVWDVRLSGQMLVVDRGMSPAAPSSVRVGRIHGERAVQRRRGKMKSRLPKEAPG